MCNVNLNSSNSFYYYFKFQTSHTTDNNKLPVNFPTIFRSKNFIFGNKINNSFIYYKQKHLQWLRTNCCLLSYTWKKFGLKKQIITLSG